MRERKKIKSNRAKCGACGDIIESTHRHDFVRCGCGKTFVDGGLNYLRRGFTEEAGYEDLSEYCTLLDEVMGHFDGKLNAAAAILDRNVTVNGEIVDDIRHEVNIGDKIEVIGWHSPLHSLPHIVEDNPYGAGV